ncbi:MAG: esterase-like activity of phytase family protein [Sphingobium sp.]
MQRVALLILLLILLLEGRTQGPRTPRPPESMILTATPLPLDPGDPARRRLGDLVYLGGWALTSSSDSFGGISSMRISDAGDVLALSDAGERIEFSAGGFAEGRLRSRALMRFVPTLPTERLAPASRWDTESMAWDPSTGMSWVGFEGYHRICRYTRAFGAVSRCAKPPAVRAWPHNTGMESLARLPDGRFVTIAEEAPGPAGWGHDMLVFPGDPVDPDKAPPARLTYVAPPGYLPTDALWIGPGRMVVLNRRVTLAEGFTAVVTLLDIRDLRPGRVLEGRVVARLTGSVPHDNFEALALSREGDTAILWVASDDNHLMVQRTLLLKFALPPAWTASHAD